MEILGHHASCNDEWSSFGVNEYIYEFHIYRLIGLFHTQNIKNIPIEQAYVRLYLAYPDWARTLYGNYDSLQIQLYEADWGSEFDLDEDFDCMTSLLSEGTYIPSLENTEFQLPIDPSKIQGKDDIRVVVKIAEESSNSNQVFYNTIPYLVVETKSLDVTSVNPKIGHITNVENLQIIGSGFYSGINVKLTRDDQADIVATNVEVISDTEIQCTIPIPENVEAGMWNVEIENPNGNDAILEDGFEIRPPIVILVHGFNSAGSMWESFKDKLESENITYLVFDYEEYHTDDPRTIAPRLQTFIENVYDITDYNGKFDIICHSMGAMVTRFYIERDGGYENIRQWIGIAPVNHGSALGNLVSYDEQLENLYAIVCGIFNWNPDALNQMAIGSEAVQELENLVSTPHGYTKNGVKYRVITGYNPNGDNAFFFPLKGYTFTLIDDNLAVTTVGDCAVAGEQSYLIGVATDCFPIGGHLNGNPQTSRYNHINICNQPDVQDTVVRYLKDISVSSSNIIPKTNYLDWRYELFQCFDVIYPYEVKNIKISTAHDDIIYVKVDWPGSELDLELISPSGSTVNSGHSSIISYEKTETSICFIVESFESGEWTAKITAVDVSPEGELFTFTSTVASFDRPSSFLLVVYSGWNFISIPSKLEEGNNTAAIFETIDMAEQPVYSYDAESGTWMQLSRETILNPLDAYWIYSREISSVPLYYQNNPLQVPGQKHLYPGWNAIGTGSDYLVPASMVLSTISGKWFVVLRFNNQLQYYEQPITSPGEGSVLESGHGYWIYLKEDGEIVGIEG